MLWSKRIIWQETMVCISSVTNHLCDIGQVAWFPWGLSIKKKKRRDTDTLLAYRKEAGPRALFRSLKLRTLGLQRADTSKGAEE